MPGAVASPGESTVSEQTSTNWAIIYMVKNGSCNLEPIGTRSANRYESSIRKAMAITLTEAISYFCLSVAS